MFFQSFNTTGFQTGFHKRVAVKVKNIINTGFKWSSTKRSPFEAQCETMNLNRKPRSPLFSGQNILIFQFKSRASEGILKDSRTKFIFMTKQIFVWFFPVVIIFIHILNTLTQFQTKEYALQYFLGDFIFKCS